MAKIYCKSSYLLRRDTAANWSAKNPILREGEEGYETDTGKRKVGNGTTEWNNLKYDSGIVDQTYSPTSANAQSGKAVAEAIDPRTVYQKFIDDNKLKQRNWVDLSFVGGEYYYTDFLQAVADINADTTVNSTTDSTNAVCQIFKNDEITVLRLLSDIPVTTEVIFEKSVIFDVNGCTISLSNNGIIGKSGISFKKVINYTFIIYGAKIGSVIIANDCEVMLNFNQQYSYLIGGEYKLNLTNTYSKSGYVVVRGINSETQTTFEVINANIYINDNRTSGYNSYGIFFSVADINKHIFNIYNTKIFGYSTATATSAIMIGKSSTLSYSNAFAFFKKSKFKCISQANKGDNASLAISIFAGNIKIDDCYIEGMTSGLQNKGTLYLNNCICKSPAHGGIYNATNGVAYLINSEFHRNPTTEGYTPTGTAAAYFGYGSIAYIDGCSFILDIDGDTSDGIAIKQGSGTIPTKAFISNSEIPKLRCDSGQYVYLGEGISDTIKNATVSGTKVLTDNLYSSYIE